MHKRKNIRVRGKRRKDIARLSSVGVDSGDLTGTDTGGGGGGASASTDVSSEDGFPVTESASASAKPREAAEEEAVEEVPLVTVGYADEIVMCMLRSGGWFQLTNRAARALTLLHAPDTNYQRDFLLTYTAFLEPKDLLNTLLDRIKAVNIPHPVFCFS